MQIASSSRLGDLRLAAGEAFSVERVFRTDDGLPIDVTGRQFILTIFAVRGVAQQLDLPMTVIGAVASAVVSTAQSLALATAKFAGASLAWQITEWLGASNVGFSFGPRALAFGAAGAPTAPTGAPAAVGGPAVVQAVGPDMMGAVRLDGLGVPGFSAAQIVARARPDELADDSDEAFAAWLTAKASGINLLDLFPVAPRLAAEDIDGNEQLILFKGGALHSITLDQLALALARYRTLNLASPTGAAIADAMGLLG